jgi:hypothetical protein
MADFPVDVKWTFFGTFLLSDNIDLRRRISW